MSSYFPVLKVGGPAWALFLDVDGTLLNLAEQIADFPCARIVMPLIEPRLHVGVQHPRCEAVLLRWKARHHDCLSPARDQGEILDGTGRLLLPVDHRAQLIQARSAAPLPCWGAPEGPHAVRSPP